MSRAKLAPRLMALAIALLLLVPMLASIALADPSKKGDDYVYFDGGYISTKDKNSNKFEDRYKKIYIQGKGLRPAFFPNVNDSFYPDANQTAASVDLDYHKRTKSYFWYGKGPLGWVEQKYEKKPDPVILAMLLWYGYGGPGSNYNLNNSPADDTEVRDYIGIEENLKRMLQGGVDEKKDFWLTSSTPQWQKIENMPRPDIGIYPDAASWLAFDWASGQHDPVVSKVQDASGNLVQATEEITLKGSQQLNSVNIPLKPPLKLVRSDGKVFSGSQQAEVFVGQSFHIEAPLTFTGSFQALDMPSTKPVRFYPIILQFGKTSRGCEPRLVTWDVDYASIDLCGITFKGEGLADDDLKVELEKVDTACFALKGAKFVLGYKDNNSVDHYYTGKDNNGHATWGDRSQAKVFETDASGKIYADGLPKNLFFFEEIEAPNGYKLPADRNQRFWWVVTEENKTVKVQAVNEPLPDVDFRKVSASDTNKALQGAEFALYGCSRLDVHAGTSNHILTVDPSNPLNCWVKIQDAVSDAYGNFSFKRLPSGEYRLVETKAPDGYHRPLGQWQLIVDAEQGVAAANSLDPDNAWQPTYDCATIVIANDEDWELPATGGWAAMLPVAGAVLIASAGLLLLVKKGRGRLCKTKCS